MGLWQWFLASAGVVFASSLDGFMAGMAYAIKGLRIRPHHYWIIGICTGTMMGISMFAGGLMALAMPDGIGGHGRRNPCRPGDMAAGAEVCAS